MMVALTVIETLIDLTLIESDAAAKRLGNAVRNSEKSQEKNALLVNYRQEYVEKWQATLATGLSIQQHKNYQEFIGGLDRAIAQQSHICLTDHGKVLEQKNLWQQSERKRLSYTTLSNRAIDLAKKLDDKREQKNTDEFAARKYSTHR
jgi:flagellar FliJ protein